MSDGRYTIEYHEERESHGRKSGLGIKILDRLTDKQRSPGDLSGGETFYTALSLALGLADVVVAESGGVDLGTLFIDEGFGSLDPDTLDSVLTEISHLRRGGRVVGIVSHVDELKQRISERIEIRRLDSGHSAITVVA
jgi:exonuclease SbcC